MAQFRLRHLTVLSFLIAAFAAAVLAQPAENCTDGKIFTSKSCIGDTISAEEKSLFDVINKYRIENGRPAVKLSTSLSLVANRRMLDINQNMKMLTHSWSNCRYDIKDEKTWQCQIESPKRLNSGYKGEGYETLYRTTNSKVDINAALAAWKKSELHSSIILNKGMFESMPWDEFGVAISGSYASLWFGYSSSNAKGPATAGSGSTASYDQTVTNVFQSLAIEQKLATTEPNGFRGFSPDKKLKVEIWGTKRDLVETTISITVTTSPDGRIDSAKKGGISKILRDMFPEWTDVDSWLDNSINLVAQNRTAWRTKAIRGVVVEMKAAGSDAIMLSIKPQIKKAPIEM